jgi:hypothetical protein
VPRFTIFLFLSLKICIFATNDFTMKEIVDKVSILFETSPNSFTIKKHYNYYATERYGILNSYHIMLKYNE